MHAVCHPQRESGKPFGATMPLTMHTVQLIGRAETYRTALSARLDSYASRIAGSAARSGASANGGSAPAGTGSRCRFDQ